MKIPARRGAAGFLHSSKHSLRLHRCAVRLTRSNPILRFACPFGGLERCRNLGDDSPADIWYRLRRSTHLWCSVRATESVREKWGANRVHPPASDAPSHVPYLSRGARTLQ
jgi:hypothetical protein